MTPVSKVQTPLLLFPVEAVSAENAGRFLAEIETDAKRILGSFGRKEHGALRTVKLPNGGCLNCVFEHMGVPYALLLLPNIEAS
jgi:hypothetical protein